MHKTQTRTGRRQPNAERERGRDHWRGWEDPVERERRRERAGEGGGMPSASSKNGPLRLRAATTS
eukprot:scaffold206257_cov35-Tisochrysis_lutea.AAC.3